MLIESLRYPLKGADWLKTIVIGGILGLLSVLIVPILLVDGYFVRELRSVIGGEVEPPRFGEWGDLLVDGVKAFVITLLYALIPFVIFLLAGGAFVLMIPLSTGVIPTMDSINAILNPLGVGVAGILAVLVYYLIPAALANFSVNGSIRSGFEIGSLRKMVFSGTYLVAWLIALGILVVFGAITSALNLTVIGAILTPFVAFYAAMAAMYLYGTAYRRTIGTGTEYYAEPAPEAPTGV